MELDFLADGHAFVLLLVPSHRHSGDQVEVVQRPSVTDGVGALLQIPLALGEGYSGTCLATWD